MLASTSRKVGKAYQTVMKISWTFPKRIDDVTHLDDVSSFHLGSHCD